jgi:hypothetical protein
MLRRAWSALASIPWWVWLTALLALILRLASIGYGLPYQFDPDEYLFVASAGYMAETGHFDPLWYGIPAATLMDILAGLYTLFGTLGTMTGQFDSVAGAVEAYRNDPSHFFILGRFVSALSGALVVPVAYVTARELRITVFWASLVALILALSPPMIEYASIIRPDMLLTVFLLATVTVMMRAMRRPSAGAFALGGAFLGLAATSKYPGALGLVPILVANVTLTVERRVTPRRGLLWLGVAALAGLLVTALVGPYLLINWQDTVAYVLGEARDAHLGATGTGLLDNLWRYLTEALQPALGTLGVVLGVVGSLWMLSRRRPRLLSLTYWAFLLFISALSLWWLRWSLPLVPLLAVSMAYLLSRGDARLGPRLPERLALVGRVALAAVLVAPLIMPTVDFVRLRAANDDVRLLAIDWVYENVPAGTAILIDSYTTHVSTDDFDVVVATENGLERWADFAGTKHPVGYFGRLGEEWPGAPDELLARIEAEGIEYVMLARPWIWLFQEDPVANEREIAVYEALLESYPIVAEWDDGDAPLGWDQIILRVGADATDD